MSMMFVVLFEKKKHAHFRSPVQSKAQRAEDDEVAGLFVVFRSPADEAVEHVDDLEVPLLECHSRLRMRRAGFADARDECS